MANKRHRPADKMPGATNNTKAGKHDSMKESVPNYPGLPGNSGPDRSQGIKKLKVRPQDKGL